jgi:hypothetical protein
MNDPEPSVLVSRPFGQSAIEFVRKVFAWLREPSTWLSLSAAAVSLGTFYIVQAKPGRLIVVLPDRVGLLFFESSAGRKLSLVVPLTFTNTGAGPTLRHVTSVHATLSPEPAEGDDNCKFAWQYEKQFVGAREWLAKHPDENSGTEDYFDYVGRAFTFTLSGGTSKLKFLEMIPLASSPPGKNVKDFGLVTEVFHDGNQVTRVQQRYRCDTDLVYTQHIWCNLR